MGEFGFRAIEFVRGKHVAGLLFVQKQDSIAPTPHSKRVVSLHPDDENMNRINDPSSWNTEDGPVDQVIVLLSVFFSFLVLTCRNKKMIDP